tara:strand:- start:691 stop:1782 length:1092 start_codon:yes stop_codon:yes gene_type:complete
MKKEVIFLCGARDFHAMDWYRSAKEVLTDKKISIVTDLIDGEGFEKLIHKEDEVYRLFILDKFLFKKQSSLGNLWRNIMKIIILPIQVFRLKKFAKNHENSIFYAHAMYYLFLAWAAKIDYVGTPQGSDVLVRPFKSKLYKYFAIKALKSAKGITVDSVNMNEKIKEISGVESVIVQNGIDVQKILSLVKKGEKRERIQSIRGFTPLYKMDEMLKSRNLMSEKIGIYFTYPFHDETYKKNLIQDFIKEDIDEGLVSRSKLYALFNSSKLIISIPVSDSSPKSVYESIFFGCCVAVRDNPYINILPRCMKDRLIIVNFEDPLWLMKAMKHAEVVVKDEYIPSEEAVSLFDKKNSIRIISNFFFN